jgi:LmbE family N-acetylglucosaminyl deacetylase
VHLTNGSPDDLQYAFRAGCKNKKEYAALRLKELNNALNVCGFKREHHYILNGADQKIIDNLYPITLKVLHLIKKIKPSVVITHSYEGGHPDHDCAAFIVSKTLKILSARPEYPKARHIEFSGYHGANGYFESGTFLHSPGIIMSVTLPEYNRKLKKEMVGCYTSQKEILSQFNIEKEMFRIAPVYDFRKPPHCGKLLYEQMNWGTSSSKWRKTVEVVSREIDTKFDIK